MYALSTYTAPTVEPLSVAEARAQVRLEHTADDAILASYIKAAREWYEAVSGRALITQTLEVRYEGFPGETHDDRRDTGQWGTIDRYAILLPRCPVQSLTHVKYVDGDGVEQTITNTNYAVDLYSVPGRITPAYGYVWPSSRRQPGAVTVRYVAGYGAYSGAVPESIRQLLRLLVAHSYETREPVVTGTIATSLPMTVQTLLWQTRDLSA